MNRGRLLLIVRLMFLALFLGGGRFSSAGEPPAAPANQLYDPDLLLSSQATADLSQQLKDFQAKANVVIYLAIYTVPPGPIEETARTLNQAWNQTGYGVVIAFAPRRRELRVLPSPQLSLLENADGLTEVFRKAAQPGLARGDDAAAAASGVAGLRRRLGDLDRRLAPPAPLTWRPSRGMLLLILAGLALAGLALLWFALRVLRRANVFDHSYRLPEPTAPAALRFGGRRCGGHQATSDFRALARKPAPPV